MYKQVGLVRGGLFVCRFHVYLFVVICRHCHHSAAVVWLHGTVMATVFCLRIHRWLSLLQMSAGTGDVSKDPFRNRYYIHYIW